MGYINTGGDILYTGGDIANNYILVTALSKLSVRGFI